MNIKNADDEEFEDNRKPKLNFYKNGKFYIYGDIDDTIPEQIIAPLGQQIHAALSLDKASRGAILIDICSDGGYYKYAMDIVNLIQFAQKNEIVVQTTVFSNAASAASMIAIAGTYRFVTPTSVHLAHFARSWAFSHNPEMAERNLKYDKFIQSKIVELYKSKTKIKDIEKKLLADNFMVCGGSELIKAGFADRLV